MRKRASRKTRTERQRAAWSPERSIRPERAYPAAELSRRFHMNRHTIAAAIKSGIVAPRRAGKTRWFLGCELIAWLRSQAKTETSVHGG